MGKNRDKIINSPFVWNVRYEMSGLEDKVWDFYLRYNIASTARKIHKKQFDFMYFVWLFTWMLIKETIMLNMEDDILWNLTSQKLINCAMKKDIL